MIVRNEREEWAALVAADTLHLLPPEALIASIKDLAQRLLDVAPTEGAEMIAKERRRQIEQEGWSDGHDDTHTDIELARAAHGYVEAAVYASAFGIPMPLDQMNSEWPWDAGWWKPSNDPVRNLTKAGALIAAEIDRLQRAQI